MFSIEQARKNRDQKNNELKKEAIKEYCIIIDEAIKETSLRGESSCSIKIQNQYLPGNDIQEIYQNAGYKVQHYCSDYGSWLYFSW